MVEKSQQDKFCKFIFFQKHLDNEFAETYIVK